MQQTQFGEIIEPEIIPFTFSGIAWIVLASILLLCLLIGAILWIRIYRRNSYRRSAIQLINNITNNTMLNDAQTITEINRILKRVALTIYKQEVINGLLGINWINFLNSKSKTAFFDTDNTLLLLNKTFNTKLATNKEQLNNFIYSSKKWITKHDF